MGEGANGALGLLLMWIAFVCFFVAFHPGGLEVNGHKAQNPVDVIIWLMQRIATGKSQAGASATADTASDGTQ